jgi:5-methylthioadenosine/S-adenosylhomocysteine deaminase
LVRTDDVNMLPAPGADAAMQLVQHAQPYNVDTVLIDGRLRKHRGRLVDVDAAKVVADAASVQAKLRERAVQAR